MIKKILINIILIVLVFISFDVFIFHSGNRKTYNINLWDYGIFEPNDRIENDLPFDKTKRPIVTIGCSFIYGSGIKANETLAYKIQKLTRRKTYNLGYPGTGIQHVLEQLKNSDFFNKKDVNPEYFIYVFISDHMRRLYANYFSDDETTKYMHNKKTKDNKLIINNWNKKEPLDYIKVTGFAKKFNTYMYLHKSNDELFDFFKLHLIEIKKIIDEKYDNTKFVIVVYNPNNDIHGLKPFYTNRWKELEQKNVGGGNFKLSYLTAANIVI